MKETVVVYCEDCPDLDSCRAGYSCDVVQLVAQTCREQGVPMKVTDPATLRKVATLLALKPKP